MKTPRGQLVSLTFNMKRYARYGDVQGLRTYMCSDAFLQSFAALDPPRRRTAMLAYAEAEAMCEARARHPLGKPKALGVHGTKWRDPVMLAKLRNAYAKAGTDEGAARLCGVTPGAARLAKKRYLDVAPTAGCAQAA